MSNNILEPKLGEYHHRTVVTNPNESSENQDSVILDVVSEIMSVRNDNKIITALHLEFTYIDDPNVTKITYAPHGLPEDPGNDE